MRPKYLDGPDALTLMVTGIVSVSISLFLGIPLWLYAIQWWWGLL